MFAPSYSLVGAFFERLRANTVRPYGVDWQCVPLCRGRCLHRPVGRNRQICTVSVSRITRRSSVPLSRGNKRGLPVQALSSSVAPVPLSRGNKRGLPVQALSYHRSTTDNRGISQPPCVPPSKGGLVRACPVLLRGGLVRHFSLMLQKWRQLRRRGSLLPPYGVTQRLIPRSFSSF